MTNLERLAREYAENHLIFEPSFTEERIFEAYVAGAQARQPEIDELKEELASVKEKLEIEREALMFVESRMRPG